MRKGLTLTMAAAALAALTTLTGAGAQTRALAPLPPFITVQFGRAIEGSYAGSICGANPVPNMLTLAQVAADLQSRGLAGTAAVVVNRTGTSTELCVGGDTYADWSDLQSLQGTYGWSAVSAGATYTYMTTETEPEQVAESCGSLSAFTREGFPNADGLFAYPDNYFNNTIQSHVVEPCFFYGRTYRGGVNNEASMNPIGFQNTNSITGGRCSNTAAPCYTMSLPQVGSKVYTPPAKLIAMAAGLTDNQWLDLQFYRIVTGAENDGPFSWDCTSSDPTQHWTSQTEMYCQGDFDAVLAALPAGTVSADPATVAAAWGRPL